MARYVRVSSISFPGVSGGENHRERTLKSAMEWIDRASYDRPDVICLPETFTGLGCPDDKWVATAEPVPGPTTEALAERARAHNCYIVCPIVEKADDKTYNSAVLIGRRGEIIGSYHKVHPTIGEIEKGVTPGTETPVFETDFGKVGIAICYDLNFHDVARGLKDGGAEIVFFPSMFRGGLILSIWAFMYRFFMVSATPREWSAIVNPVGRVLERSSLYERIISRRLNLDAAVLHLDYNSAKFDRLKKKYGPDVEIEIPALEGVCLIYSHHSERTVWDMIREFELEPVEDYFDRATRVREEALRK